MAENMKVKYDKYWGDVEKMNKLIFLVVVLDPRHKMQFVRNFLGKGQYENPTHSSHDVDSVELKAPEDAFSLEVNSNKYHILGQRARDVLAMLVSIVASKFAFSTGGRVLTCYRSSLTPKTIETLICTQNWCKSSLVSIDIEELVDELENLESELAPIPQLNEGVSDIDSD
ncbi:unnamed protein product [Vicia faba]|uniref:Uncharacterized protein n=1 Tax=Vicia faba TaxID=3906 RepID=A0AAV0Z1B6_VICFA|nr:unnamed protein product [Vicia faba]